MSRRAPAPSLDERREQYAESVTRAGWVTDPRIERAFSAIPREAFLTPPPWTIFPPGGWSRKETSDPAELYDDVLVVLDADRGVNNGQPSLHASWLSAVAPAAGETAIHVGAGAGYYTALLAFLVVPGGRVEAYEIDPELAAIARRNLSCFDHVAVHGASAIGGDMPPADVVYVNAGLSAPEPAWLKALKPGGRLIFPWQPLGRGGVGLLVTRGERGFEARAAGQVGFVSCEGAAAQARHLGQNALTATRSVWLAQDRAPDDSATAIFDEVWFSSDPVPAVH